MDTRSYSILPHVYGNAKIDKIWTTELLLLLTKCLRWHNNNSNKSHSLDISQILKKEFCLIGKIKNQIFTTCLPNLNFLSSTSSANPKRRKSENILVNNLDLKSITSSTKLEREQTFQLFHHIQIRKTSCRSFSWKITYHLTWTTKLISLRTTYKNSRL